MSINLNDVDINKLKLFLNSFDNVLCDCDGVIWHLGTLIPGADQSISELKKIGKKVRFVTNNSYLGLDKFCDRLKQINIDTDPADVANPCLAIIHYLKKKEFTGNICVLGSSGFKQEIRDAGFNIFDIEVPSSINDNLENAVGTLKGLIQSSKGIGAIIFDIDVNMSFAKLSTVLGCLKNSNVLFMTACADRILPLGPRMSNFGPEYYIKPIQDLTGREPLAFGKPATKLNEFLVDKFQINDPSRTLFIGDSLEYDIEFASKLGYQTLLVLTGNTQLEEMNNCTNKDSIPNFYLESLGDLHKILNKLDL